MLASGHAMCVAWGEQGTFLYNDAYAPILGTRHPSALGKSFRDAWPDIWDEIEPLVVSTFDGNTSTFRDMPLVMTRNGYPEDTWWTFSYSPLRDDEGRVAGLLNVTLETTERVHAERQRDVAIARLRDSEERLRALVNASSDSLYTMSADWTEMRQLDGRGFISDTKAPSVRWMDLYLLDDDRAAIQNEIDKAVQAKAPFQFEHRVRRPDGTTGWTFSRAVPVLDKHGAIVEWFGMAADVTARHEATESLRASEEFNRSVLASSTDCIKVLSLDGRIEFMSQGGMGGMGVMDVDNFEQVRGRTWPEMLPDPASDLARAAIDAAARGETSHFECEADTLKGRRRWWNISVSPVRGAKGEVAAILSVSRDHTELHDAREQEGLLSEELAHRLKNTLGVVQAIAFQTLGKSTEAGAMAAFADRLQALSAAHDVLVRKKWSSARLLDVVESALKTFSQDGRIAISGPDLAIGPRASLSLSLLLHELATNAIKYGALSSDTGRVSLNWEERRDVEPAQLAMMWTESDGPPAKQPTRRGFGSRIIRMGLVGSGDVELTYGAEGFSAEMTASLADIENG